MELTISELNKLSPIMVLDNEIVKERFISLYEKIHDNKLGEQFYEKERYNFLRILQGNADLQQCTGFSIYGCFLDLAQMGLSLEIQSKPLLYVMFYNIQLIKGSDKWERRAKLDVSPYGELALRMQAGQISHVDKPVIVYQGDSFQPYVKNGIKSVDYMPKIPRQSKVIIASFIGMTRPDGTKDYYWMLIDDIERLKAYSSKKNKGTANALYNSGNGGIDSGFLEAKTIKHALNCFPKIKVGQFSQITNDEPDAMAYGLAEETKPEQFQQNSVTFDRDIRNGENQTVYEEMVNPETITVKDDEDIF